MIVFFCFRYKVDEVDFPFPLLIFSKISGNKLQMVKHFLVWYFNSLIFWINLVCSDLINRIFICKQIFFKLGYFMISWSIYFYWLTKKMKLIFNSIVYFSLRFLHFLLISLRIIEHYNFMSLMIVFLFNFSIIIYEHY